MSSIKSVTDLLASIGHPLSDEDITDQVLRGLDDTYRPVVEGVNARDTPIAFEELHEKLVPMISCFARRPVRLLPPLPPLLSLLSPGTQMLASMPPRRKPPSSSPPLLLVLAHPNPLPSLLLVLVLEVPAHS